jgi:hypothetical protein
LIIGEPGIGKTPLADEVSIHAASAGMNLLRAGCRGERGLRLYWAFIQVLRAALDGSERDALLKLVSTENALQLV